MRALLITVTGALTVAGVLTASAANQEPPRGHQVVGRVVSPAGQPLAEATISLRRLDTGERFERTTDEKGVVVFDGLAPAWYGISASKSGYAPTEFGATRPGGMGTPVVVDRDAAPESVTLRLMDAASIAGVVRQTSGAPMGNVRVEALAPTLDTRGRALFTTAASAMTDDRGQYRLSDLPADSYIVRAVPPRAPISPASPPPQPGRSGEPPPAPTTLSGYAETWFPSQRNADEAVELPMASAERREGVDILVRRVPYARLEGRLNVPGAVHESLTMTFQMVDGRGAATQQAGRPIVQDGGFVIADVPPGRYLLRAQARVDGVGPVAASRPLVIVEGQTQVDATLTLTPLGSVIGRARIDAGGSSLPASARLALYDVGGSEIPRPALASATTADGAVTFLDVEPGRYRMQLAVLPTDRRPLALVSVRVDDVETVDTSFEVRAGPPVRVEAMLTTALGVLEGTLRSPDGSVPLGHTVIVFPEERAGWATAFRYVTAVRPAADGRFLADRILPGRYRVAVVTDPRRNEWFLPAFLESIVRQSVPVVIDAQTPARLDLVAGR